MLWLHQSLDQVDESFSGKCSPARNRGLPPGHAQRSADLRDRTHEPLGLLRKQVNERAPPLAGSARSRSRLELLRRARRCQGRRRSRGNHSCTRKTIISSTLLTRPPGRSTGVQRSGPDQVIGFEPWGRSCGSVGGRCVSVLRLDRRHCRSQPPLHPCMGRCSPHKPCHRRRQPDGEAAEEQARPRGSPGHDRRADR